MIFKDTNETTSPAASDEVTTSTTATCNEAYLAMRQFVIYFIIYIGQLLKGVCLIVEGRGGWVDLALKLTIFRMVSVPFLLPPPPLIT